MFAIPTTVRLRVALADIEAPIRRRLLWLRRRPASPVWVVQPGTQLATAIASVTALQGTLHDVGAGRITGQAENILGRDAGPPRAVERRRRADLDHVRFLARLQAGQELAAISMGGIGGDHGMRHAGDPRSIQQLQR